MAKEDPKTYEKPGLNPLGNGQAELSDKELDGVAGGVDLIDGSGCNSGEGAAVGCNNGNYPGSHACGSGTDGGPR